MRYFGDFHKDVVPTQRKRRSFVYVNERSRRGTIGDQLRLHRNETDRSGSKGKHGEHCAWVWSV